MAGIWWLASYPKSGSTWLRAVIASLVSGRAADINALGFLGGNSTYRFGFDDALGIESAALSFDQVTNLRPRVYEAWAAEAERPIYCKTHDAYRATPAGEPLFPASATRGAVYVVRDPRAVVVSFSHHSVRPVDEMIERMESDAAFGRTRGRLHQQIHEQLYRWSDHAASWLAAPFPVHVLRYEDMHADPAAAFAGLARFLGLPSDPERIAVAVDATVFSRLQAQERAAGFSEKPHKAEAFFREGSVDGWRRVLTPEQAARIVAAHGAVMQRLGYDVSLAPLSEAREADRRLVPPLTV
jgi:aryl sulfotransferase